MTMVFVKCYYDNDKDIAVAAIAKMILSWIPWQL